MHGEICSGLPKGGEPLHLLHQFCAVGVRKLHFFFPFSPVQTKCILSPSPFQVNDHCLVLIVCACEHSHFFDSVCREVKTVVCAG